MLWICVIGDPTNCGPVESDEHYKDPDKCMEAMYEAKAERAGLDIIGSSCKIKEFPLELGVNLNHRTLIL